MLGRISKGPLIKHGFQHKVMDSGDQQQLIYCSELTSYCHSLITECETRLAVRFMRGEPLTVSSSLSFRREMEPLALSAPSRLACRSSGSPFSKVRSSGLAFLLGIHALLRCSLRTRRYWAAVASGGQSSWNLKHTPDRWCKQQRQQTQLRSEM